jgi:hypothetical protein
MRYQVIKQEGHTRHDTPLSVFQVADWLCFQDFLLGRPLTFAAKWDEKNFQSLFRDKNNTCIFKWFAKSVQPIVVMMKQNRRPFCQKRSEK